MNNSICPSTGTADKSLLRYVVIIITSGVFAFVSWAAFMPPFGFLTHTLRTHNSPVTDTDTTGFFPGLPFANALIYFIVLYCLFKLSWIDQETMEIPDRFHIIIVACGLFAVFLGPDIETRSHLIGIGIASVPLFVIMIVCLLVTGVEAFGFGDVKLMAAAGFFLGWQHTLVALFLGIIIGGVYGSYLLATRKKRGREHFAFGPALCIGIGIAMFAADPITKWYLQVL